MYIHMYIHVQQANTCQASGFLLAGVHDFQQSTWAFQQDVDLDLVRSDSQVPDESDDTPLFTHRCCVRNSLTPGARLSCVLLGRVMWDTLCHESCVLSSSPHTPDETKAADVCELPPGCAPLPSGRPCGGAPRQEQQGHWGAKQARAELREVHASAQRARPQVCVHSIAGPRVRAGPMSAVYLLRVERVASVCCWCRCQRCACCTLYTRLHICALVVDVSDVSCVSS